jgi:hypothetical protein
MAGNAFEDVVHQLDSHFSTANQAWLLGAGISVEAGLPLMGALTSRVRALATARDHEVLLELLINELPADAHIEHVLSQLGDYSAIAARLKAKAISVGGQEFSTDALHIAHTAILDDIATTIRWGYVEGNEGGEEKVGSPDKPLPVATYHLDFVCTLFEKRQAGRSDRFKPTYFFTTNYDTLIEDALAMARVPAWDGFSGGAVAYRSHQYGQKPRADGARALVVKLHGSIDWVLGEDGGVWRVRDSDAYPPKKGRVLIHPQSTKYLSTQRDPFASQFDLFRRTIGARDELVLGVVGYSFGDDHVNEEIERALFPIDSKLTLVAFCVENKALPVVLQRWLTSDAADRIFVLTERGVHWGRRPRLDDGRGTTFDWWKFTGATAFLRTGSASA